MEIILPKYGPIPFVPVGADHIKGLLLPGSQVSFCEMDFGTIILQQYNAENYSLRYIALNFLRKASLLFNDESAALRNQLLLQGRIRIKSGKGKVNLREGQFVLFNRMDKYSLTHFENLSQYRIFDTSFSLELLEPLFTAFPSLKDFLDNSGNSTGHVEIRLPQQASTQMTTIVYNLLQSPYDENLRKIYFENKVNDFLFEALVQSCKKEPDTSGYTPGESDSIYDARRIILSDITKHFSIKEISRQVGLNEFKLKRGFKKFFGFGLFECLLQARMEKAKELIIESDKPLKEIAAITGFEFLTNFVAAFRKYFGYTPGELRRK